MQDLTLPTSLERLCLHNVLREGAHPELHLLSNLEHLKVGAQAKVDNYMTCLPRLPASLLKLDLLDGGITNLGQLTLLTRLKKLGMPLPPNAQQMSVIKRLRQLRHVSEAPGMEFLPVHTSRLYVATTQLQNQVHTQCYVTHCLYFNYLLTVTYVFRVTMVHVLDGHMITLKVRNSRFALGWLLITLSECVTSCCAGTFGQATPSWGRYAWSRYAWG